MSAGDHFGEMALLDTGPRSATVRALTPVEVLALPIAAMTALADAQPHLARVLIRLGGEAAARLRQANTARVRRSIGCWSWSAPASRWAGSC